jgi:CBS domain-containing protein
VRDTDTIEDAAALLTEHTITTAPVPDETGTPVGIVSDANLRWRRVPGQRAGALSAAREAQLRPNAVTEVISPYPLMTTPLTDIADVPGT